MTFDWKIGRNKKEQVYIMFGEIKLQALGLAQLLNDLF